MEGMPFNRSELMSRIRGRNTAPELILRAELRKHGLRVRSNPRTPYGRPDVGLAGRVCIFVDGCFWHGCPEHYVRPRSRQAFWSAKLAANVLRDERQTRALEGAGWRVLRFWEHEVESNPGRCAMEVLKALVKRRSSAVTWRRVLAAVPADKAGRQEFRLIVDIHRHRTPRLVVTERHTGKWKRRE